MGVISSALSRSIRRANPRGARKRARGAAAGASGAVSERIRATRAVPIHCARGLGGEPRRRDGRPPILDRAAVDAPSCSSLSPIAMPVSLEVGDTMKLNTQIVSDGDGFAQAHSSYAEEERRLFWA
jgi:hypothetical protein